MKCRQYVFFLAVLVLFSIPAFAFPGERETGNEDSLKAAAYQAYYEILRAAIDKHDIVKKVPGSEKFGYTDDKELSYAELIYFNNDELPLLLYVCGNYDRECYVYGYSDGKARLFTWDKETDATAYEGAGADNYHGFEIATGRNGVEYLRVYTSWKATQDEYYTVKNGKWTEALRRDYSPHIENDEFDWYVNGTLVSESSYYFAPETELGIISTRRIPECPDTVYDVLSQLGENMMARGYGTIFEWPARGPVSRRFGRRMYPIVSKSFHSGIDIVAPHGTKVKAADIGKVLFEGWYRGLGQTVVIGHGRYATIYARLSSILVKEGDIVSVGSTVGTTGYNEAGYGFHFEVREGNTARNPLNYLKH